MNFPPTSDAAMHAARVLFDEDRYQEALPLLRELAEGGAAQAQFLLGWMFETGSGVAENLEQARAWYGSAAQGGSSEGAFYLGKLYEGACDYSKAREFYQRAAGSNFSPAMFRLGRMHHFGKGVTRDLDAAMAYYESAERHGHILAIRNSAQLLIQGQRGVLGRARGVFLYVKGIVVAVRCVLKEEHSVRFLE